MTRRRRVKIMLWGGFALLLLFVAATVRLFLLPAKDSPRHVDAIVVLGGSGPRLVMGVKLARAGYAPNLLISVPGQGCPASIPGVRVACFQPDPSTTQGEARYVASAARVHGWKTLIVIPSTEQTTRARIRFKRCTDADIAYVSTPIAKRLVLHNVAYEWAALGKALVFQRGC